MMNKQKNIKKFALVIFVLMSFLVSNFHVNTAHAIAPVILYGAATVAAGALATNKVQNIVVDGFKWFLYGVFSVCAFLAMLAAEIFSYVLDVSHLQAIMANPVVWEMWKIVRDFMNLFFIFVLLLSAFYTIFQVDKYSYKNVLSKVIFGALFVNFSFPIARAIIDVGNVMMYSFIVDIFGMSKDGLTSGVLSTSGLKGLFLLSENNLDFTVKYFLIAIICMFMFGVSFLTLALMMFYRLFMLPILVMFSPIGFVAGAIPGMEGYSKQWWDKLIKNVFYGPIAVFMVMLAVQFMKSLSSAQNNTITKGMVEANGVSGDFLASIVYMTIPIIFFWIAITSAEKMSSEAGGLANSFGSKFLKKSRDWGKNKTIGAGKWAFKPEGAIGRRTYGGIIARRQAKNDEMKKYNEGIAKERLDALGKPGKDAAREKMDEADKKIIAKGAATGASEKEKATARIALKRLNDRKRSVNNEDIKKEKQRLEDSGDANDASKLLEEIKKIDALPPDKLTRDQRMKRAALSSHLVRAQSQMSKEERSQFVKTDPAVAGALSTNYDDMIGGAPTGLTGAALARYTAEKSKYATLQTEAQMATGDLLANSYVGTDKEKDAARMADQLKVEKFLKEKALMAVREGDGHGTDGTVIT